MAIQKNNSRSPGTIPDKLQPHNIEAEEATLGSLLIDPDAVLKVASFLKAQDFFAERRGWIYQAMADLHEKRQPADLVTLTDELTRRGQLAEIGGAAYLTGLMNATPTSIHVEYYARIVERTAILRRLINAAGDIARLAHGDTQDAQAVCDRAEEILFGVTSAPTSSNNQIKPVREPVGTVLDNIDRIRSNPNLLTGLPTGLEDLDKLLGGLQRSDVIVIAGRPGIGKTSLALSIGLQAARKHQKNVAVFSLEMSDEQLVQRLLSSMTGIDTQRLRLGAISEGQEWSSFMAGCTLLSQSSLYIDDTPAISVHELRAKARRLHAEQGLDLIIIDYLQLMRGDDKSENRQQEISYISRSIKALARELNVPILALSQLSRQVESRHDKRPILSDLRESGSIEQDADVVIFVYRDDVYNPDTEFPNIAEIIVSKHRSGPTGIFSVYFKKHLAQFVNLEVRQQPLEYSPPATNGKPAKKLDEMVKAYHGNGNGNGNGHNGDGQFTIEG